MSDKVVAIEREIQKIEERITNLKKDKPGSNQGEKIHEATLSLLKDVINDLRQQQKKIR